MAELRIGLVTLVRLNRAPVLEYEERLKQKFRSQGRLHRHDEPLEAHSLTSNSCGI